VFSGAFKLVSSEAALLRMHRSGFRINCKKKRLFSFPFEGLELLATVKKQGWLSNLIAVVG
jgi:hypothetical protein